MSFVQIYKYTLVALTILVSIPSIGYASDETVCKYVISGEQSSTINFNAELFRNIKEIHILPIIGMQKVLLEHPYLNEQSLIKLIKCQLRLETSIPVHSSKSSIPILERHELRNPQNIRVWVALDVHDSFLEDDDFDMKTVTLVITYSREGIHNIKAMQEQCSIAFPLYEDREQVLRAVTHGIGMCLSKPYHDIDIKNIDPNFLKALKVN